ncbi:hypothetical protein IHE45_08G110100 [Dioscorea alata]|uniref:Uncharacterized protein n=1 Tax=Dioscorea alata TaxID=55571 RepID=A0ACB7VLC8_DIOAL|nr:hypothetical protein IHE45_08G110100 [Dioscorea alata]
MSCVRTFPNGHIPLPRSACSLSYICPIPSHPIERKPRCLVVFRLSSFSGSSPGGLLLLFSLSPPPLGVLAGGLLFPFLLIWRQLGMWMPLKSPLIVVSFFISLESSPSSPQIQPANLFDRCEVPLFFPLLSVFSLGFGEVSFVSYPLSFHLARVRYVNALGFCL